MVPYSADSYIQANFAEGLAQHINDTSNSRCGTVIIQSTSSGSVGYPYEGTWYVTYTGYSGTRNYLVSAMCIGANKAELYYAMFYIGADVSATRQTSQWYKYLELAGL